MEWTFRKRAFSFVKEYIFISHTRHRQNGRLSCVTQTARSDLLASGWGRRLSPTLQFKTPILPLAPFKRQVLVAKPDKIGVQVFFWSGFTYKSLSPWNVGCCVRYSFLGAGWAACPDLWRCIMWINLQSDPDEQNGERTMWSPPQCLHVGFYLEGNRLLILSLIPEREQTVGAERVTGVLGSGF